VSIVRERDGRALGNGVIEPLGNVGEEDWEGGSRDSVGDEAAGL